MNFSVETVTSNVVLRLLLVHDAIKMASHVSMPSREEA